ncbi:winged helix-turn-helix transcriptional regulator [Sinomicrobium weinanense]|uniref:Helix-turn-helix transcriptional regulator n=1 Tax=Sinomicrobium weinanense TaxID=2842200 RepID=A0A926JR58_9FLAO|nr:helix-turn-helix domain-containing protein [Sinomicrobium weinanense]MBC9795977.1 helix-turn-helix transcriptional regulator [Sinomicrobium weinanense]MBU3122096.1 helix-turn-helix transcriptional regulator [Sinomicrobium weinanense]
MKRPRIYNNPENCPVLHTAHILGSKWNPVILYCLMNGNVRFGKFTVLIPTISRKVLSEQLKELEHHGLIIRKVYREKPPRVEYSLSPKGLSIIPVIDAMCAWGRGDMENPASLSVYPKQEISDH